MSGKSGLLTLQDTKSLTLDAILQSLKTCAHVSQGTLAISLGPLGLTLFGQSECLDHPLVLVISQEWACDLNLANQKQMCSTPTSKRRGAQEILTNG